MARFIGATEGFFSGIYQRFQASHESWGYDRLNVGSLWSYYYCLWFTDFYLFSYWYDEPMKTFTFASAAVFTKIIKLSFGLKNN